VGETKLIMLLRSAIFTAFFCSCSSFCLHFVTFITGEGKIELKRAFDRVLQRRRPGGGKKKPRMGVEGGSAPSLSGKARKAQETEEGTEEGVKIARTKKHNYFVLHKRTAGQMATKKNGQTAYQDGNTFFQSRLERASDQLGFFGRNREGRARRM